MKPVFKDYLISLLIAVPLFLTGWAFIYIVDYVKDQRNRIWSFPTWSESKNESIKAARFMATYKLDSSLSQIDPSRLNPDTMIWTEKYCLGYYRDDDRGESIHIADSMQESFYVHTFGMLDNSKAQGTTIGTGKWYTTEFIDHNKQEVLATGCAGCIHQLKFSPDTMELSIKANEFVYKGKICLVKEN